MTAQERYRKKPVVIDAIQWTGENLRAVIGFTDGPPDTRTSHAGMMWEKYEDLVKHDGLKIYTLEGTMSADVGDYIIKGVKGEFYPCKPDIFAATYDPADLAAVPAQVRVKPLDTPAAHELKLSAGIPNLPTQLTYDCRIAMSGEGPRGYDWTDKPHRLVYDLCREIEAIAAIEPQPDRVILQRIGTGIYEVPSSPDPRDEVIARLVEAGSWLSVCAQTTGGTAGRDDDLVNAISGWTAALAAAKAVQK